MRELEGRSYDEIADRLGSTNGAVRQLLNRARVGIRDRLTVLPGLEPLMRWLAGGSGGATSARIGALAGGCTLSAKLCASALVPAVIAGGAALPGTDAAPRPKRTVRATVTHRHASVSRPVARAATTPVVHTVAHATATPARAAPRLVVRATTPPKAPASQPARQSPAQARESRCVRQPAPERSQPDSTAHAAPRPELSPSESTPRPQMRSVQS
jgi:hypothetical protein